MSVRQIMVCKICCADLDRSAAFYARLGFAPAAPVSVSEGPDVPQLYGVAAARLRSQVLARADDPRAVRLELLEWDTRPAAAPGPGAAGAGMLGLMSDDLLADYEALRREGVDFISEPAAFRRGSGTTWVVHLRDPDGFNLQLLQVLKSAPAIRP